MPGGFTWADALAGYQEAGQLAIDIVGWLAAISFLCGAVWVGVFYIRDRNKARLEDGRRRREANPDWGQDDIYRDSNQTPRRAS